MKKLISLLLCCLLLLTLPVCVMADDTIKADYDILSGRVEGSFTLGTAHADVFALFLLKGTEFADIVAPAELGDISALEGVAYYYDHYISDSNGKFSFSFSFPEDAPVGNYLVLVTNGSKVFTHSFIRYDEEILKQNIETLNSKTSKEEFVVYFWELFNAEQLPVIPKDYTLTESFKTSVTDSFFNNKENDVTEFKNRFNQLYFSEKVKNCEREEYISFISENAENLGIDASYAKNLTPAQKSYFLDIMVGKEFESAENYKKLYEEAVVLTLASKAENYQEIKNAVSIFGNVTLDFDGDYKKVSDSANIYKKMLGKTYESIEDIVKGFNNAIDEVIYEQERNNGSSAPNAGGGGGSHVGSTGGSAPVQSTPVPQVTPFSDIKDVPWAYDAITSLQAKGVLQGDGSGKFYPSNFVTRNEFIKMLVAAFGLQNAAAEVEFKDVSKEGWEYIYIASASKLGIIKGKSVDEFGGNDKISREDMALIIYRLASLIGVSFEEKIEFSDSSLVSEYAKEAVSFMAGAGLVKGNGENFEPKDNAQRAHCAVIISRLLERTGANK